MNGNAYVEGLESLWANCDFVLKGMSKRLDDREGYDYYEGIVNDQKTCKWIAVFIAPLLEVSCSIDNKYSLDIAELGKFRVDVVNFLERLYNTFDPCNGNSKSRLTYGDMMSVCHNLYHSVRSMEDIISDINHCTKFSNVDDPLITIMQSQIQSAKLFISKHFTKGTPGFVTNDIVDFINNL